MLRHRLITAICSIFTMAMAIGSAAVDNLPMTLMWGIISIFEILMFCIVVLSDVNVEVDE